MFYFEPGDTVRIIGNGVEDSKTNPFHYFEIGSVGKVLRCIKHECLYLVKVDGLEQIVSSKHMELVPPYETGV